GLNQLDRKTGLLHRRIKPLRLRPRLQPDPLQAKPERSKPGDQRRRLAQNLALANDLAARLDNAHARVFQRHVDSCIMVHGRPSMMLGADTSDSVDSTPSV